MPLPGPAESTRQSPHCDCGSIARKRARLLRALPGSKRNEHEVGLEKNNLADYWALFALLGTAALAASAKEFSYRPDGSGMQWTQYFMGVLLSVFALVKFFNPSKFADGFQMYDLLAKHFRPYALVCPVIELTLGLGYLSHWEPQFVQAATIVVLGFGVLGRDQCPAAGP